MRCRHCQTPLNQTLLDLGTAPPSNAYLSIAALSEPECYYPLRVLVCNECWLVQTQDYARPHDLFDKNYAYFSGFSTSWLKHCEAFVDAAIARFSLGQASLLIEVAANDGSLLQFVKAAGIPCFGIEPTASTAAAARAKGIEVIEEFLDPILADSLAKSNRLADLVIGNNVLAHVPDINQFVAACRLLLKPQGVIVFEFPHLMQLVNDCQFDTVYHEHYSYLSLTSVARILSHQGLQIIDVQSLPTHGGSLRVFAQRADHGQYQVEPAVATMLTRETQAGLATRDFYSGLQRQAENIKDDFLQFLLAARSQEKSVGGYGAAAKGNTLLNFAGVRADLLPFVADANPAKQGKFLPGSRIPIVAPQQIQEHRPDYLVVFPWNLIAEISHEQQQIKSWGGRFVTFVPTLKVHS